MTASEAAKRILVMRLKRVLKETPQYSIAERHASCAHGLGTANVRKKRAFMAAGARTALVIGKIERSSLTLT
jgi:hypothetical protein